MRAQRRSGGEHSHCARLHPGGCRTALTRPFGFLLQGVAAHRGLGPLGQVMDVGLQVEDVTQARELGRDRPEELHAEPRSQP